VEELGPSAKKRIVVMLVVSSLVVLAFVGLAVLRGGARGEPVTLADGPQVPTAVRAAHANRHTTEEKSQKVAYVPPPTAAPELAALVDRNGENRIAADITTSVPRACFEKDIRALVSVLLDTEDEDTARNETANLLRRSGHRGLTDNLIGILNDPEEGSRFRAFCVQHLWMNLPKAGVGEREKITSVLRRSLNDRHVPVRREALLALVRMRDPRGDETAVEWLTAERAEGVRDAAIRYVRELGLREHAPIIRKYLRDENDVVRIAAIVTLSQWGDKESRPAIEEAGKSQSYRLRRCAKMALKRLDRAARTAEGVKPRAGVPVSPPKGEKEEPTF